MLQRTIGPAMDTILAQRRLGQLCGLRVQKSEAFTVVNLRLFHSQTPLTQERIKSS